MNTSSDIALYELIPFKKKYTLKIMKKLNLTPEQKKKRAVKQKRLHYLRNKEKMNQAKIDSRKERLSDSEYLNYFNKPLRRSL